MLDYKDNYLLKLLIQANYDLRVDDIQKLLGVSKRSAYYSIEKIDEFLTTQGLPKLVHTTDKGITLNRETKDRFSKDIMDSISDVYVYTPNERVAIEILVILCRDTEINISFLESLFHVSRNTIINDLKQLRKTLGVYNLSLEYDNTLGYIITGLETQRRSVLHHYISRYDYVLKMKMYPFYNEQSYGTIKSIMRQLELDLHITYVHTSIENLSVLISIIKDNHFNPVTFRNEDVKQIQASNEYQLTKKYFEGVIPEAEYLYIAIHLMGLRLHVADEYITYEDEYIKELVAFLIDEFSKITLIYFDEDNQLYKSLYYHMKQTINRLKYGIIYQNKLKEEIFESYPQVSQITKTVCDKLEEKIGYPINDDDVSFIAMHFGSSLKRQQRHIHSFSILLVCLNGVASSKLIRKEIEFMFPSIHIIDAVSLDDVATYQDDVDYIVSTIPIHNKAILDRVIQVNGILNDVDKDHLRQIFGRHITEPNKNLRERIMAKIKPYIKPHKIDMVERLIEREIINKEPLINTNIERMRKPMMKELLTAKTIILQDHVKTWEDAIWLSAKPLLESNSIEERYVEKVIDNVHEMGPYIGIAPDVAISHARPEDGVHHLGISLLLLQQPVYLANRDDKPVRIMITLASPDSEIHLTALQQLSGMLMGGLDQLLAATSKQDILQLVDQYSK
ncbi:BglG family transcription antiterminator [Candidatus Xianfuyuplasma coldseepsis]|uniref:BglG family transcription antiterminator n=1 Tax=Candidatus Xianfuyuplasma coldseepsis TaxID=2782163 RepID=A0A7L7KQW8_9MOLU|nr:BglG family transcription antiterminator [Xianfuyuplasma coldseepsis]QMS85123.1 BglG family transcription antiterminator [Xianfuyuplasma coldseepsis]